MKKDNDNDLHAFLIMSRSYSKQLNVLLKSLDISNNAIYLHVDLKSRDVDRVNMYVCTRALFKEVNRIPVNWAAFSQVEAELILLKAAVNDGPYKYYHLLSGVDLPIKSNKFIHDFFRNKHEEYIDISGINRPVDLRRVKYFYPLQEKLGKKRGMLWLVQKILVRGQQIFHVNRLRRNIFQFYGKGSTWFSITHSFAEYVVDNRCLIYKAFGKGRAIDEMFMQTLLVNSKFKNTLADAKIGNLRFIEWGSARSPKEFTDVQDGMKLLQSDKIFARKFNMEKGKNLIFYVIRNRDK